MPKKKKHKVVIYLHLKNSLLDFKDVHLEEIKESFPELNITSVKSKQELMKEITDADVYFGWGINKEIFKAAKKLKWIHSGSAGVGASLFPEMVNSNVILTNSRGLYSVPIAEHVMGLILTFSRGLHKCIKFQLDGKWGRQEIENNYSLLNQLDHQTMGIVGLGGIGLEVAKRAKGFDMEVLAVKRNLTSRPIFVDKLFSPSGLSEVLKNSDYVVLCVPHTKETVGMIGEEELKMMKNTAILINVGRGRVIKENVLIKALKEGWIGGAGLDVFIEEPLPEDSEFYKMENVIVTPHVAGLTQFLWDNGAKLFVENLRKFIDGKKLINVVDKEKQY